MAPTHSTHKSGGMARLAGLMIVLVGAASLQSAVLYSTRNGETEILHTELPSQEVQILGLPAEMAEMVAMTTSSTEEEIPEKTVIQPDEVLFLPQLSDHNIFRIYEAGEAELSTAQSRPCPELVQLVRETSAYLHHGG